MNILFGGISLSKYQVQNTIIDGWSKGSKFAEVAGNLLNQALGVDTWYNSLTIFIIDQQLGTIFQLPVNPADIRMKWTRKTETVNILNLGEIDFTTGDKLQEISFSSFFPHEYVPTYCMMPDLPTPESANAVMNGWKSRFNDPTKGLADPLHLILTGAQDINMNVILTSYSSEERGGEPGDIYYDVTFREWKSIAVRTESEEKQSTRVSIKERPKLVKISTPADEFGTEESLWKLAKQHYGNGKSWGDILEANAGNIARTVILP